MQFRVLGPTAKMDAIERDVVGFLGKARRVTGAVAVFTDEGSDRRETVDVDGTLAVAEVSAALAAGLLGLDC